MTKCLIIVYNCVIATVFKLSVKIRYYKRLLKNIVFGGCVCMSVHLLTEFTFGPLQQILFYIDLSDFQYIFISMRVTATAPKKAQPIRAERPNLGDDYP